MRFQRQIVEALLVAAGVAGCVLCGESVAKAAGWVADQAQEKTASADAKAGAKTAVENENLAVAARAICPIVYPVDETPSAGGYQYIFYGNAFFIGKEGYLITAAHVLHSFRDGGQPYILVSRNEAPAQMLKAEVVAVDLEHDVAVLRATPNPFQKNYRVAFLSLGADAPVLRGEDVVVAALRPSRRRPRTFETELQDRSAARLVDYQSSQLEKGLGDTDLMLFSHEVILGQSGAPVLSGDGRDVVGFIEGQWLHPAAALAAAADPGATSIGAAVPIRYAIALLREKGIPWHAGSGAPVTRVREGELH
jgi:S1-C subfamily serine protease